QHVLAPTRLEGPAGLIEVIGQLQGFEAAAGSWESEILPARVQGYDPDDLDRLCLGGQVVWGRLSGRGSVEMAPGRRGPLTRTAPITLALREDLDRLLVRDQRRASLSS